MGSRCQANLCKHEADDSSGLCSQVQPGGRRGEVAFVGAVRGIKARDPGGPLHCPCRPCPCRALLCPQGVWIGVRLDEPQGRPAQDS